MEFPDFHNRFKSPTFEIYGRTRKRMTDLVICQLDSKFFHSLLNSFLSSNPDLTHQTFELYFLQTTNLSSSIFLKAVWSALRAGFYNKTKQFVKKQSVSTHFWHDERVETNKFTKNSIYPRCWQPFSMCMYPFLKCVT